MILGKKCLEQQNCKPLANEKASYMARKGGWVGKVYNLRGYFELSV